MGGSVSSAQVTPKAAEFEYAKSCGPPCGSAGALLGRLRDLEKDIVYSCEGTGQTLSIHHISLTNFVNNCAVPLSDAEAECISSVLEDAETRAWNILDIARVFLHAYAQGDIATDKEPVFRLLAMAVLAQDDLDLRNNPGMVRLANEILDEPAARDAD